MNAEIDARSDAGSGRSLRVRHDQVVAAEFAAQPMKPGGVPLGTSDLAGLPAPVRRYIERSGAVGRLRPHHMRVVLDANMYRKPGQAPMRARSVQYSFFGRPARLFLMEARMFRLPVRALHVYRQEQATFTVRVASTVTMVDLSGEQISAAETSTRSDEPWRVRGTVIRLSGKGLVIKSKPKAKAEWRACAAATAMAATPVSASPACREPTRPAVPVGLTPSQPRARLGLPGERSLVLWISARSRIARSPSLGVSCSPRSASTREGTTCVRSCHVRRELHEGWRLGVPW